MAKLKIKKGVGIEKQIDSSIQEFNPYLLPVPTLDDFSEMIKILENKNPMPKKFVCVVGYAWFDESVSDEDFIERYSTPSITVYAYKDNIQKIHERANKLGLTKRPLHHNDKI